MKQLAMAAPLALMLVLAACGGSNSSSNPVSGNWSATLTDQSGIMDFTFTTSLQQNGGNVSGTNLTITTGSPCFDSGASETGSFTFSGNMNGQTSGSFNLTIQSEANSPDGNNTMTLQGTLNNNTISGSWTLAGTGTGCFGSGNFTMTRM
jgi:outer membrane lipopolysaccharide assembly protein LptE/RlpB